MAKQTKRARKFVASGGVKKRLEKGTITNKGKLKRRKTVKDGPVPKQEKKDGYSQELEMKRKDEDFTSAKNLGDLDMDSFFRDITDKVEESLQNDEGIALEDNNSSEKDSSDSEKEEEEKKLLASKDGVKTASKAEEGDSDSDSEEDIEEAEARMKREINKDPEFRQFLEENESTLLDMDDDDDNIEDGDGLDEGREQEREDGDNDRVLTAGLLKRLCQGAFDSHGIKSLKKLVTAYNSACHMTDTDDDRKAKQVKYEIPSEEVFDKLMVTTLAQCFDQFHHHLLGEGSVDPKVEEKKESVEMDDENKPIPPKHLEGSFRFQEMNPVLTTFFKATMHLLTQAKDPEMLVFVLKAMSKYIQYMTPFPRLAENMLKVLVALWSAPIDSSEDYQVVRLHSFLRIRQLALTQPFPFIEECLKKLYLAYAKRAKFASSGSATSGLQVLTFMGNCVVELYALDYHSSYQHAFIYIRQLALHLRNAMHKKTAEAFSTVYCWQYMHCLKLWTAVLTEACISEQADRSSEDQMMKSLLFPLIQVILGTCRLVPSTRYLPLRLHCVRLLQQLAAAGELFIPTTSILLDVFDLKELSLPPKKAKKSSDLQPVAFTLKLRADGPLRTMEELEMCVSEVFLLLNRELDLYQFSAGFPEFTVRISQRLRKFSKDTRNPRWRAYAKACLEVAERGSERAMKERAKLNDIAPKDVKRLEILKPTNTLPMAKRYEAALEKEKRLQVAARPAVKSGSGGKSSSAKNSKEAKKPKKAKNEKGEKKPKSRAKKGAADESALNQEDQVQEGIDWSDEE